jgi:hypothetical protein
MSGKRANELRRRIVRTLRGGADSGTLDEWTRRELRRAPRRRRAIDRHEAEAARRPDGPARSRRYAARQASELAAAGDAEAAAYWQAIADGAYSSAELADAIADPTRVNLGTVGGALVRAEREARKGRR